MPDTTTTTTTPDFYQSQIWTEKRKQILQRDDNQCRLCCSITGLQVHHKNYDRFGGDELDTDLITLCQNCHPLATLAYRHQSWVLKGNAGENNINEASSLMLNQLLAEIKVNDYKHQRLESPLSSTTGNGGIQLAAEKEPSDPAKECADVWFKFQPENPGEVTPFPGIYRSVAKRFDDKIISSYMKTYNLSKDHAVLLIKEFINELAEVEGCPIDKVGGLMTNLCKEVRDRVYQGMLEHEDIVPLSGPDDEEDADDAEEVQAEDTDDKKDDSEPLTPEHVPFPGTKPESFRSKMKSLKTNLFGPQEKAEPDTSDEVQMDSFDSEEEPELNDYRVSISSAGRVLQISVPMIREMVAKGILKARSIGTLCYISETSVKKYLVNGPLSVRSVMSILDIFDKTKVYDLCSAGKLKDTRLPQKRRYQIDRESLRQYMLNEGYGQERINLIDTANN